MKNESPLAYNHLATPIGNLWVGAQDDGVAEIVFRDGASEAVNSPLLCEAIDQLQGYFAGKLTQFHFPMAPVGTDFQRAVWRALLDVQYADTCSYSDIASAIKNPKAVRAVGAANGRNPIAIVVPCHRVIGANGSLTGYNGGLHRKQWLLAHEANIRRG
ncbi:methylated-DNA--[protein]-cysteine S-methyltransferase [Simiduia curdlanivorans]|uniref:Methylated-DNA--protein-cysteine methyltransferase n=1 Tax=Simiduia curdlanivorans TaxID=1492769 RepID=A0ABV8V297_9GAMM|nr:methylated-DNA--[protein]-cysteine S-methyltransferase [Simiduia curdlanivorans]MDN3640119.1 methylated-DNA--[protein]-cysteine S-methyltransferase [Simiduia curdlanivorans]